MMTKHLTPFSQGWDKRSFSDRTIVCLLCLPKFPNKRRFNKRRPAAPCRGATLALPAWPLSKQKLPKIDSANVRYLIEFAMKSS